MNPAPHPAAPQVPPLGHEAMDGMHEEFAALLAVAADAADHELLSRLQEIAQHCAEHFGQEDLWMQQHGFPGRACHEQEHGAVLASIAGVMRRVERGELVPGRTLVSMLGQWFPAHAQHLDSALAHWMSKRRWGGKPVVLHREAAQARPHLPTN